MAYKWILNGCEIRYLSNPKPIQNQTKTNTEYKIISKHKLVSFSFCTIGWRYKIDKKQFLILKRNFLPQMGHPDFSGDTGSLNYTKSDIHLILSFTMNQNLWCASLCLNNSRKIGMYHSWQGGISFMRSWYSILRNKK